MSPSAPSRSASRVVAARLLAVVAIVWTIAVAVRWGQRSHHVVDFHPINGSFQTFDPIRRMQEGQWPGRDFDAYLGLGPVHLTRVATSLFGGTFHDSLVSTVVLCSLLHALLVGALARLAGASRLASVLCASIGFTLGVALNTRWLPDGAIAWMRAVFWPVASPGNSLLGVRAFAPLVAIGVLAFAIRFARASDAGRWRVAGAWVGAAAGVVLPWSNDYGPVTWFLVLVGAAVFAPRAFVAGRRMAFAAIAFATSLVVAACVATVATGGAPLAWLDYNWAGVAHDQAWYYHMLDSERRLPTLSVGPYVVGAVGTIAWWWLARRSGRLGDAAIAIYVAATFAAAVLASRASPSERYFEPLYHLLWVATPVRIVIAARDVVRRRATERACRVVTRVATASFGVICVGAVSLPTHRLMLTAHGDETAVRFGVEVPEAGGTMPGRLEKIAWTANRIREECDRDRVPSDRRLVSTYVTMLDLLTHSFGPSGDDYLIHALGHERRARFVERLHALEPRFVTTIRDEFTPYERWLRKQNWAAYAEILEHYDPWDRLPYAVVWHRRDTPRPASDRVVTVARAAPDARGTIELSFALDPTDGDPREQIVEVELTSPHGLLGGRGGWIPSSEFAVSIEHDARGHAFRVGLPPDEPAWRTSVCVVPGTTTRLEIVPPSGRSLSLDGVAARVVIAKDDVDGFRARRLVATSYTDDRHASGVSRAADVAAFLVTDPGDLTGVVVGDRLRFASSGERRVVEIRQRFVRVDGPPLSPEGDGHPHVIEVLPR